MISRHFRLRKSFALAGLSQPNLWVVSRGGKAVEDLFKSCLSHRVRGKAKLRMHVDHRMFCHHTRERSGKNRGRRVVWVYTQVSRRLTMSSITKTQMVGWLMEAQNRRATMSSTVVRCLFWRKTPTSSSTLKFQARRRQVEVSRDLNMGREPQQHHRTKHKKDQQLQPPLPTR